MLTGTTSLVQFLIGRLEGFTFGFIALTIVLLAMCLGWWLSHFASRYGRALLYFYTHGQFFNELTLFCWAAFSGRYLAGLFARGVSLPSNRFINLPSSIMQVPRALSVFCALALASGAALLIDTFGISAAFVYSLLALMLLLALAIIDAQTGLLPNTLTFTLLWMGLLGQWVPGLLPISLHDAVLGVVGGYSVLMVLFFVYQFLRKQEGMGQGDFKLVAAFGAWLGWKLLTFIILLDCVASVFYTICFLTRRLLRAEYSNIPILVAQYLFITIVLLV